MDANLGTITAFVKLDFSGLTAGMKGAQAQMNVFAKSLQRQAAMPVNQLAQSMGRDMMLAGAGMAAGFGVAMKKAAEFDQAMRNVNSLAKMSEAQFGQLRDAVKRLADDRAITEGPVNLAKGLYDVVSSGFSGQKALEILRISAMGASAGLTDTATASRVLMAVLNSGISGFNSIRGAMDILFREVDLGVNTFEGLANALGDVLPTAKVAGVSLQEISAALVVMTRRGININEAVTALNQLLNHIVKPGKEAQKMMDALGISYGAAAVQSKGLTGWLQEVINKTHGNADALTRLVPEIRGMKALLTLADEGGRQYTDMLKGMSTAQDGAGSTQKALNQQLRGAQLQYKQLTKDLEKLAIDVGEQLMPAFRGLVHWLDEQVRAFGKLPDASKRAAVEMAVFGTAALLAGGFVLTLTTRVIELRNALVVAGVTAAGVAGRLAAIARFAANPGAWVGGLMTVSAAAGTTHELAGTEARDPARRLADLRQRQAAAEKRLAGLQAQQKRGVTGGAYGSMTEMLTATRDTIERLKGEISTLQQQAEAAKAAKAAADALKAKPGAGGLPGLLGGDDTKAKAAADRRKALVAETYRLTHSQFEAERREAQLQYEEDVKGGQRKEEAARLLAARLSDIRKRELKDFAQHYEALGPIYDAEYHKHLTETIAHWSQITEAIAAGASAMGKVVTEGLTTQREATASILEDMKSGLTGLQTWATETWNTIFRAGIEAADKDYHDWIEHQRSSLEGGKGSPRDEWPVGEFTRKGMDIRGMVDAQISDWTDLIERFVQEAKGAFVGLFENLLSGSRNWLSQFLDDFKRMLVQMAAEWLASEVFRAIRDAFSKPKSGEQTGGGAGGGTAGGLLGSIGGPIGAAVGSIFGGVLGFDRGGWVPGPPGAPRAAVVHGGEFVMSQSMLSRPAGAVTINVHASPGQDIDALARRVAFHVYRQQPVRIGSG